MDRDNCIEVSVDDLVSGMIVSQDVRDKGGRLLLRADRKITKSILKRIRKFKVPSVFIYLRSYNIFPVGNRTGRVVVGSVPSGIEDVEAGIYKPVYPDKEGSFSVHNAFFLQLGTLINNCARETFRPDIDLREIKRTILRTVCSKEILNLLINLRVKAQYLLNHSVEVALLSTLVGTHMGLNETRLKSLALASILHDVGMTQIGDDILFKATPLSIEESNLLREHAAKSVIVLSDIPGIDREVREIIYQHHERFNGTGYPKGLTENIINNSAKILSVCDVYSAISHDRCYRERISPHERIEFFFGSGNYFFSYEIVKILLSKVCIYYKGQWVRLNTGQVGIISGIDLNFPTRPHVKLIFDEKGNPMLHSRDIFLGDRMNSTIFIESII